MVGPSVDLDGSAMIIEEEVARSSSCWRLSFSVCDPGWKNVELYPAKQRETLETLSLFTCLPAQMRGSAVACTSVTDRRQPRNSCKEPASSFQVDLYQAAASTKGYSSTAGRNKKDDNT